MRRAVRATRCGAGAVRSEANKGFEADEAEEGWGQVEEGGDEEVESFVARGPDVEVGDASGEDADEFLDKGEDRAIGPFDGGPVGFGGR